MKTTLDLPPPLLYTAKALSAMRGESLKDFVISAIQARINCLQNKPDTIITPAWMTHVGELAEIKDEIQHIQSNIDAEFEKINAHDWQ